MTLRKILILSAMLVLASACDGDTPSDGGTPDMDGGATDAGNRDAGSMSDSGPDPMDAGPMDAGPLEPGACRVEGPRELWHRVELRCAGPAGSEADSATFTDFRMNVEFASGSESLTVAGHFAADGDAGESGSSEGTLWRAYFMPPAEGTWTYTVSFREGEDIAVSLDPGEGTAVTELDGETGSFDVGPSSATGNDMRARGLLEHRSGERYLRFRTDGRYFIEGGMDSPENLFGYSGFDNTDKRDSAGSCKGILHEFAPHMDDWEAGDPTWGGGRGQSLIGLINYIAGTGVNAIYVLPMSVDGDGCDAHPWVEYDGDRRSFDVSKLDQWEVAFSHMEHRGLLIHYVTQETENDQLLDGGELGMQRRLYYREIVSRFAHHPALQWNLGEENTNTPEQVRAYSDYLRALDPYAHPIVKHTYPGEHDRYEDMLGHATFDGPTLQYGAIPQNATGGLYGAAADWIRRSREAGQAWYVTATEASGNNAPTPDSEVTRRQRTYWMWASVMSGGAGFEWYLKNDGAGHAYDLAVEDLREFDAHWAQTGNLVRFFRGTLQNGSTDLHAMEPNNDLTAIDTDWVLADPGNTYLVYFRDGVPSGADTTIDLTGGGEYRIEWFNPESAFIDEVIGETLAGEADQDFGPPPNPPGDDWVMIIRR